MLEIIMEFKYPSRIDLNPIVVPGGMVMLALRIFKACLIMLLE
jgi:hypothetical protein